MATATFLGAASVFTVDTVDLADQLVSITMNKTVDALESTSLKDASRTYVKGLENSETTFTVLGSFVTAEAIQSIFGDVGNSVTIVFEPITGAPATSSPRYTHTGAFLATLPIVVNVGELVQVTATYTGGAIVQAVGA
jgi:hypothetical protein